MPKPRLEKEREEIIQVLKYRDGNYYVGVLATAKVYSILGASYGDSKVNLEKEIQEADRSDILKIYEFLSNYINYMKSNPVSLCPCCGQQIVR